MFDSLDLLLLLLTGVISAVSAFAFRALPAETQRRWKPRVPLIFGPLAVLALVVWLWLVLSYRP